MMGVDGERCVAVGLLLLPCGMDATLWTIAIGRCEALWCSVLSVPGRCEALWCSSSGGVDHADDAVCPCASPASEVSVPSEVRTVAALP